MFRSKKEIYSNTGSPWTKCSIYLETSYSSPAKRWSRRDSSQARIFSVPYILSQYGTFRFLSRHIHDLIRSYFL